MARTKGAASKEKVIAALQAAFPASFITGKDLRINFKEDGADIQLKVALTCVKEIVPPPNDVQSPEDDVIRWSADSAAPPQNIVLTSEEENNIVSLIQEVNNEISRK